jgi:threonine dehydrogenase-like Zn-dependent dehydrogenase
VLGSMAVLDSYGPPLDLMVSGLVDVKPLLTHDLPLESYPDAFETLRRSEGLKLQPHPEAEPRTASPGEGSARP